MYKGPLELPKNKVDIMRRYNDSVEEEDFLISFLFDRFDRDNHKSDMKIKTMTCNTLRPTLRPLEGKYALHRGWQLISKAHCMPTHFRHVDGDTDDLLLKELNDYFNMLQNYYHGSIGAKSMKYAAPNDLLIMLAMQLSNGNIDRAVDDFLETQMKSMWKDVSEPYFFSLPIVKDGFNDSFLSRDIPQCLSALIEVDSREIDDLEIERDPSGVDESELDRDDTTSVDSKAKKGDNFAFLQAVDNIGFDFDKQIDSNSQVNTFAREEDPPLKRPSHSYSRKMQFTPVYNTVIHPFKGDISHNFRNVQSASDGELYVPSELNDITDFLKPSLPLFRNGMEGIFHENEDGEIERNDHSDVANEENVDQHHIIDLDDRYERIISNLDFSQRSSNQCQRCSVHVDEFDERTVNILHSRLSHPKVDFNDLVALLKATRASLNSKPSSKGSEERIGISTPIPMEHFEATEKVIPVNFSTNHQSGSIGSISETITRSINGVNIEEGQTKYVNMNETQLNSKTVDLLHSGNSYSGTKPNESRDIIRNGEETHDMQLKNVSVVFGNETREDCQIIAKSSGYYTVQIPVNALNDGEIVLTEKTFSGAAADAAARAQLLDGTPHYIVPSTAAQQSVLNHGNGAATAAVVIAKAKEEKILKEATPALRDDPEYEKYFKMLQMDVSLDDVKDALKKDGKDPDVMDGDHSKPAMKAVLLKDDPDFIKYFKMLDMGLSLEVVKKSLTKDGKNPGIMDLDHNKPLKVQTIPEREDVKENTDSKEGGNEILFKDDPEYVKYFKMLKMGLPVGAVKNALVRDGKDPAIMDLDPEKSLKSQQNSGDDGDDDEEEDSGPPLKEDPEYVKYFKMLKMGLPVGAVKNALVRDGKDPAIMDLDPEKSLKSQQKSDEEEEDSGPPLKEDPEYIKYFKMLKMGLPVGAVKNALVRDGKDPAIMDLNPDKSLKSQQNSGDDDEEEKDTGPPLKEDPEYVKYFKMLKMGLPVGAVKNALVRDGKDPAIMDLDPEKSLLSQTKKSKKKSNTTKKKVKKKAEPKKPKVRRKKIYWNAIDDSKVKEDSIWGQIQGMVDMKKLEYDSSEFELLFTETLDPSQKKKAAASKGKDTAKQKKSVQVIEAKKGMNGGIILARLKLDYSEMAQIIDHM
jgi:hypothetical protein